MDIEAIKEAVKAGIVKGYTQNLKLIGNYTGLVDEVRKYLLTVNVAQKLLDWNADHKFRIRIEYPVLHYYLNAFVPSKWDAKDIFEISATQRRTDHSPTESLSQKIDLAVVEEGRDAMLADYERTLAGIELKQVNTSEPAILEDLERLCKAMIKTDDVSENSIQLAICGFLRRLDKEEVITTETDIKGATERLVARWKKVCSELPEDLKSKLEFIVEDFNVLANPLDGNEEGYKAQDL